ncbi:tripartite tricarboxylate transporter TctB family protein [Paracoccus sp. TK19116]|uniref:Tripartite tricarboxylate transporter TctB family protein n=1 Tax=Paracoccus albicereus TaxID=2922394 RepID=A0ABT1MRR3_9RHOB|nr:tripartite tricarboxylate transporter TctB family protein [Paracoccus albicereus]MCQ0971002.1 tripartite tricarboxylate transporter TctB family protein [Paracoccus albicereus]
MPANPRRFRFGEFILPLIFFISTTIYLSDALQNGAIFRYGLPSASFMPIVLSVAMYLALLAVLIGQLSRRRTTNDRLPQPPQVSEEFPDLDAPAPPLGLGAHVAMVVVIAISFFYVLAFRQLGFAMSTFLFSLGLLAAFQFGWSKGVLGIALNLVVATGISLIVYLFFAVLFGIQLPGIGLLK